MSGSTPISDILIQIYFGDKKGDEKAIDRTGLQTPRNFIFPDFWTLTSSIICNQKMVTTWLSKFLSTSAISTQHIIQERWIQLFCSYNTAVPSG
jgi:hypothetical protein